MPTKIEWTEETWNPFVGCSKVSEGCRNCYAVRQAARCESFGISAYQGTTRNNGSLNWSGRINRGSDATWLKPMKLSPSMIFVNSMSDFWHPAAPDEWRKEALWIMQQTPEHTYQILTKRPENIAPMMSSVKPLAIPDNVWLGVTVEDAKAKKRIDILRRVPARIRFLSIEPLLESVGNLDLRGIHWVIIGGESGIGARPMQSDWVREIRDQCVAQKVHMFFKQFGKAANNPVQPPDSRGKGGSLLDGRYWKQYPK